MKPADALVLASSSPVRAWTLKNAGLDFEIDPSDVDENFIKNGFDAKRTSPKDVESKLAEHKALAVSQRRPNAWVIRANQVLVFNDTIFDKPADLQEAASNLRQFRGHSHELISAVCVARGNQPEWNYSEAVRLQMRGFSDGFLDSYLDEAGESVVTSVGAYRLEGLGAQLFSQIEGDYFAVLGLPLLPLLNFLRSQGVIPT